MCGLLSLVPGAMCLLNTCLHIFCSHPYFNQPIDGQAKLANYIHIFIFHNGLIPSLTLSANRNHQIFCIITKKNKNMICHLIDTADCGYSSVAVDSRAHQHYITVHWNKGVLQHVTYCVTYCLYGASRQVSRFGQIPTPVDDDDQ